MDALGYIAIEIDHELFVQIEDAKLRSPSVKKAAESFRINVAQISHMNNVPNLVAESMYYLAESWAEACFQTIGERHWPREKWDDRATYLEIQKAHKKIYPELKQRSKQWGGMPPMHLLHIEYMDPEIPLASALEGLARSMIVSAWASIEALAQELWVDVVNERPYQMAQLRGRGAGLEQEDIPDLSIPIAKLQKHKFSLEDKMGMILVDAGKVEFGTLGKMRSAYKLAFVPDPDKVMKPLISKEFLSLCKTRNVLVHNAGRMEDEFRTIATKAVPDLKFLTLADDGSDLKDGETIQFEGEIVRKMINSALNEACQLILNVDDWLQSHPA